MNLEFAQIIAVATVAAAMVLEGAVPGLTAQIPLRFGYLDHPGSALCRIAATYGHFGEEGLQVKLVRFTDSVSGLAALEKGAIDAGAFSVGTALTEIAHGRALRIIAGGGTPSTTDPLAGLDETVQQNLDRNGIVVLVPASWPASEKGTIIRLTSALIRAHRTLQQQTVTARRKTFRRMSHKTAGPDISFDPNPDYWRMLRIWQGLGLQDAAMPRDFLANHVYEEIYCDALDRLLMGPIDPVLQNLFGKAICTPNCCPANSGRLFILQGGSTQ